MVVLVDSGATHNFISKILVEKLQIRRVQCCHGTGEVLKGMGICKRVKLCIQEDEVVDEFLPINLGNSDIILGVPWLETLGTAHVNWKTQLMKFMVGGKSMVLKGDPSMGRTLVSFRSMERTFKQEGHGVLVELGLMSKQPTKTPEWPAELKELLKEYEKVFNRPEGLPPLRGREHAIVLKEGSQPVNVRPYRYPRYQKDEIEKMIREMLMAGINKHSHSPFSSHVLLVKKTEAGDFA